MDQEKHEGPSDAGNFVVVKIPAALVARIQKRLPGSDFKTVDEYVEYVISQVIAELEGNEPDKGKAAEEVFSKEDQASVEERLRDLGYM